MEPLVSIIIPAFNVEKYIDNCIKSCVFQTYKKIEIIVVDDGSTDSTARLLDAWEKSDKRIRVFHKNNNGMSKARNFGISIATGNLILFLDSDDLLSLSAIDKMVARWDGNKSTIVCGGYIRFKELNENNDNYEADAITVETACFLNFRHGYYCWGILFPKRLITENKVIFKETMRNLEDVVWLSIILLYVKKILYYPVPLYKYRISDISMTTKSRDIKWQVSCWVQAYGALKKEEKERILTANQHKEIKKRLRMCKNNIHAELFEEKMNLTQFSNIYYETTNKLLPFTFKMEYLIYQVLFKINSLIRHN